MNEQERNDLLSQMREDVARVEQEAYAAFEAWRATWDRDCLHDSILECIEAYREFCDSK